ncbi:MAG: outer membrane beta-barrel protein [Bacteroidetes bacterium]|nr:outer membrane beta-barrel protein [Bacteroidota bacterium]
MRNLLLSILFLSVCQLVQAQSFFEIGVKGGAGVSMLLNENTLQDNRINKTPSYAYSYGFKAGFDFSPSYAIIGEYMWTQLNQNNNYNNNSSVNIKRNIQINAVNIPILFRYNSETGSYIEIGPRLGYRKSVLESGTTSSDITSKFEEKTYGAILGFGNVLFATDNIYGTLGIRFDTGISDLISNDGGKNTVHYYPMDYSDLTTTYAKYAATFPISVQLMFEVNWDLGYFARSKCKKRAGFIMF